MSIRGEVWENGVKCGSRQVRSMSNQKLAIETSQHFRGNAYIRYLAMRFKDRDAWLERQGTRVKGASQAIET